MSITFALARMDDTGMISHGCETNHFATPCVDLLAHREDREIFCGFCDCVEDAQAACIECRASVNVGQANAAALLGRLGVEFDSCGTFDPADLLGRALVAGVGRDDSGVSASEDRGAGGAVLIDCGMRPGYFADRFGALADLATLAMERGALVGWC